MVLVLIIEVVLTSSHEIKTHIMHLLSILNNLFNLGVHVNKKGSIRMKVYWCFEEFLFCLEVTLPYVCGGLWSVGTLLVR